MNSFVKKQLFRIPKRRADWNRGKGRQQFNKVSGIPFFECDYNLENLRDGDVVVRILYSHGNAEDLDSVHEYLTWFVTEQLPGDLAGKRVGYLLRAWDYPFYGESTKSYEELSEESVKNDAVQVCLDFFRIKPVEVKCKYVNVLLGYSLGCAPSCYLAQHEFFKGDINILLLMAPFQSVFNTVTSWTKTASFFMGSSDYFPNEVWFPRIPPHVKKITLQSVSDKVIPFQNNSIVFRKFSDVFRECNIPHTAFKEQDQLIKVTDLLSEAIIEVLKVNELPARKNV